MYEQGRRKEESEWLEECGVWWKEFVVKKEAMMVSGVSVNNVMRERGNEK